MVKRKATKKRKATTKRKTKKKGKCPVCLGKKVWYYPSKRRENILCYNSAHIKDVRSKLGYGWKRKCLRCGNVFTLYSDSTVY